MPKKKQPGLFERSKRRAAIVTAGDTGIGTNTKRGFALIGALVREFVVPTRNIPSRSEIRKLDKRRKASKKKPAGSGARRTAGRRKGIERATGVGSITDALRKATK